VKTAKNTWANTCCSRSARGKENDSGVDRCVSSSFGGLQHNVALPLRGSCITAHRACCAALALLAHRFCRIFLSKTFLSSPFCINAYSPASLPHLRLCLALFRASPLFLFPSPRRVAASSLHTLSAHAWARIFLLGSFGLACFPTSHTVSHTSPHSACLRASCRIKQHRGAAPRLSATCTAHYPHTLHTSAGRKEGSSAAAFALA